MSKARLSQEEVEKIINLRKTGHTLNEIKTLTKKSNGTVFKYMQNVSVLPEYQQIWKIKRGGSKARSEKAWDEARVKASSIIRDIGFKEKMLILSCLYWGEGNKRELNIINSDPLIIKTVIICLEDLGVKQEDLKISIRIFEDISKKKAVNFLTSILGLPAGFIKSINVIHSNKPGKLQYGMCRLRVKKGGK